MPSEFVITPEAAVNGKSFRILKEENMAALGGLLSIAGLIFWLIILIDAFKNEVWKGIVGFICGLYLLYYAIVEFQHEKKWLIVGGWLGCQIIGVACYMAGAASMMSSTPRIGP